MASSHCGRVETSSVHTPTYPQFLDQSSQRGRPLPEKAHPADCKAASSAGCSKSSPKMDMASFPVEPLRPITVVNHSVLSGPCAIFTSGPEQRMLKQSQSTCQAILSPQAATDGSSARTRGFSESWRERRRAPCCPAVSLVPGVIPAKEAGPRPSPPPVAASVISDGQVVRPRSFSRDPPLCSYASAPAILYRGHLPLPCFSFPCSGPVVTGDCSSPNSISSMPISFPPFGRNFMPKVLKDVKMEPSMRSNSGGSWDDISQNECSSPSFVGSDSSDEGKICVLCGTTRTPLWRNGPPGPKTLCNACGIRFNKIKTGKRTPTAAEAAILSSCNLQGSSAVQARSSSMQPSCLQPSSSSLHINSSASHTVPSMSAKLAAPVPVYACSSMSFSCSSAGFRRVSEGMKPSQLPLEKSKQAASTNITGTKRKAFDVQMVASQQGAAASSSPVTEVARISPSVLLSSLPCPDEAFAIKGKLAKLQKLDSNVSNAVAKAQDVKLVSQGTFGDVESKKNAPPSFVKRGVVFPQVRRATPRQQSRLASSHVGLLVGTCAQEMKVCEEQSGNNDVEEAAKLLMSLMGG